MKKRNQRIKIILLFLVVCITLGYALLRTGLNINGIATIPRVSWDVHFENVQSTENATVEPTSRTEPVPADKADTISYEVGLPEPGDVYEFTVDVVNGGTIDAMIESISSKLDGVEISEEHPIPSYLDYKITYADDSPILNNHLLAHGTNETYKVRVAFKTDIDPEDLPSEGATLHLDLTVNYIKADENAEERDGNSPFIIETDLASIAGATTKYDIDQNKCVEHFSQQDNFEGIDIEKFCSGEDVVDPEYGDTFNINDYIDPYAVEELQTEGVIKGIKYYNLKSYDIDEEKCAEFLTNDGWDDPTDIELYCTGQDTSNGNNIDNDIKYGALSFLINAGVIKNAEYEQIKPNVIITGYEGEIPSDLVIPQNAKGGKVIGIADNAFNGKNLTSVTLPNTVEYIGYKAFYDNNITSINIPNSVDNIEIKAFAENDLTNVQLAKENVNLGNCAFGNKEDITTNNIPSEYVCIAGCDTGATELTYGYEYTSGQYTYTYDYYCPNGEWCTDDDIIRGWAVKLTDKDSTDPVTTSSCYTVDDKPIINMNSMFADSKASSIDVSSFDTSNVVNMSYMFDKTTAPLIDVSSLDTSNVVTMDRMFHDVEATEIRGLNKFDTSNVKHMESMFSGIDIEELDLSSFDTSKVINMKSMFSSNVKLKKIYASDKFSTRSVIYGDSIFGNCLSLIGGNGTVWEYMYSNSIGQAAIDGVEGTALFTDINDRTPRVKSGNIIESCTKKCLKSGDSLGVPNADGLYQDNFGNYRYTGLYPNNYAEFNGEIWRVIGIFDGKIKLIREEKLGNYSWDVRTILNTSNTGVNEWSQSVLMNELNGDYLDTSLDHNTNWIYGYDETSEFDYTKGLSSSAQSLIDNTTWYLGGVSSLSVSAKGAYEAERGNITCQENNQIGCHFDPDDARLDGIARTTSWTGKVGLLYPSDYGYASAKCKENKYTLDSNSDNCGATNWLAKRTPVYWTITPLNTNGWTVSHIWGDSNAQDYCATRRVDDKHVGVYPVVYLKPTVKVSGTGKNIDGERFTFSN